MAKRRVNPFVLYFPIAGLLVAVAIVAVTFYLQRDQVPETQATASKTGTAPSAADHAVSVEDFKSQFPRRATQQVWFQVSDENMPSTEHDSTLPDGAVYVRTNADYSKWLLGTPIELHIPQIATSHFAVVDRIEADGLGSATIYAIPDEAEEIFERLILTYSEDSTLAYIFTRAGSYELTASGHVGLLIPSSSLSIVQDPTISDVGNSTRGRYAEAKYLPRRTE